MFWESGGKDGFLCGVWLPLPSREPLQKDLCPDFVTSTHLGAGRAPSGVIAERKAACSLCAGSVSACLHPTVMSKTPVNKQFSSTEIAYAGICALKKPMNNDWDTAFFYLNPDDFNTDSRNVRKPSEVYSLGDKFLFCLSTRPYLESLLAKLSSFISVFFTHCAPSFLGFY